MLLLLLLVVVVLLVIGFFILRRVGAKRIVIFLLLLLVSLPVVWSWVHPSRFLYVGTCFIASDRPPRVRPWKVALSALRDPGLGLCIYFSAPSASYILFLSPL